MHTQITTTSIGVTANTPNNKNATQKKTNEASKTKHTEKVKHPHTTQPTETGPTHDQNHNHKDIDMTTKKAKTDQQTPETEADPETLANNRKMHKETSETEAEAEAEAENLPCRNNSHIREPETKPPHTYDHQPPTPKHDKKGVHSNPTPKLQWTRVNQHNPKKRRKRNKQQISTPHMHSIHAYMMCMYACLYYVISQKRSYRFF